MAPSTRGPQPGRNDPCPCGSGKKYKHCHQATSGKLTPRGKALLALVVAISAIGLYLTLNGIIDRAQAPGPGRVWSEEHGHWH